MTAPSDQFRLTCDLLLSSEVTPHGSLYKPLAISIAVIYIAVYGTLIAMASGMPYVMDNNESFSSLWHAHNLFEFGLGNSYGLADEAFAFHANAHPFAHTHQGNFPRLFAFVIYALGAKTVESQIIVTTFTIGLAAVLLGFQFFSKITNPVFAFIACFLLVTDYVLVGQWQVNTYRVWHEFFVFSTLLCVHGIGTGKTIWKVSTAAVFACLFYFELVFVAFLTVTCALYALALYWRNYRSLFWTWGLQSAGAVIGLSILAGQLILYLGWNDFLRDAYFTFVARNYFSADPALFQRMIDFFDSRNIVFWLNMEDGSRFRDIKFFISSLTFYEFQAHTPFFTAICGIVLIGFFASYFAATDSPHISGTYRQRIVQHLVMTWNSYPVVAAGLILAVHLVHKLAREDFTRTQLYAFLAAGLCFVCVPLLLRGWTQHDRAARRDAQSEDIPRFTALAMLFCAAPSVALHVSSVPLLIDKYSALFSAFLVLYIGLIVHLVRGGRADSITVRLHTIARAMQRVKWLGGGFLLAISIFLLLLVGVGKQLIFAIQGVEKWTVLPSSMHYVAIAGVAVLIAALYLMAQRRSALNGDASAEPNRNVKLSVFLTVIAFVLAGQATLYYPRYDLVWTEVQNAALPRVLQYLMLILAIGVAAALIVKGAKALLGLWLGPRFRALGIFVGTGMLGYAIVYVLSPGYVFSGYRFRVAPFTVFHTQAITAFALYITLVLSFNSWRHAFSRSSATRNQPMVSTYTRAVGWVSLALLALSVWFWLVMQIVYLRWLPPDGQSVVKKLAQPPYVGASFITNAYAAPIAAQTGGWAYLHAEAAEGKFVMRNQRIEILRDGTYLWFADKRTNPDYDRPQYYICITLASWAAVIEELRRRAGLENDFLGCEKDPMVTLATGKDPRRVYPPLTLVEKDGEGPAKVGYERWVILKLNW